MTATYWLLIAAVCAGIEIASGTFWFLWFALAALINSLLMYFGIVASMPMQLIVFAAVSLLFLIFTRPILVRFLGKHETKSNVDALVGKRALCTAPINSLEYGQVKLDGVIWTAFADQTIDEGTIVTVQAVEGVKLKVRVEGIEPDQLRQ